MKETFKWVLIGAFTIFIITTILTTTGLAASLGQDEDILFFLNRITCSSDRIDHRADADVIF